MEIEIREIYYSNDKPYFKEYFIKDTNVHHNPDGPAVQQWYENGQLEYQAFLLNGSWTNKDGPARQEWGKDGKLNFQEFVFDGNQYNSLEELRYAVKMNCLK